MSKKKLTLKNQNPKIRKPLQTTVSGVPVEFLDGGALAQGLNAVPLEDIENLEEAMPVQEMLPEAELFPNELFDEQQFEQEQEVESFNKDISNKFSETVLTKLGSYLDDVTKKDIEARQPWLDVINTVKPYLGFDIERIKPQSIDLTKKMVVNEQAKTFDTTFSTSLLRMWALIRAELMPSTGPVGFKNDVDNNDEFELAGESVKDSLNEYLTVEDKGFYPDYDRFLLYLILFGCVFRKIYYDSETGKPISRFILPEDFLVENNCSSIYESNRFTHIRYLSSREIIANMQNGIFNKDVELHYLNNNAEKVEGIDSLVNENLGNEQEIGEFESQNNYSGSYKFFETHEYFNLDSFEDEVEEFNLDTYQPPLPYVVTRCATTNKVVSIIPNWHPDDEKQERINCFVHYNFFPGFDIYGLGLAQIIGTNAISLTEMQRLAIDAAIFQNFPGGLRAKGYKDQDVNLTIAPGEFQPVDTGDMPLEAGFMPLPYQGPSPALIELSQRVMMQTQQLSGTGEIGIGENSAQTPVGTTMAALEVANRTQSAILRTIHMSLSEELQLLYKMFYAIPALGYPENKFSIIPISDPSIDSTTQRIIKIENILKIASSAPQMHNMYEIYKRLYKALGIHDVDQILKPEPEENPEGQPQIDPALQAQMADTEQRRLEVESRERTAMMQIEADGYKTQMNIELEQAKMELDRYIAELKNDEAKEINKVKLEIEHLKLQLHDKNNELQVSQKNKEADLRAQLELLKIEAKDKESETRVLASLRNNAEKTQVPLGLSSILRKDM